MAIDRQTRLGADDAAASSERYLRPDVLARISGLKLRAQRVVEGFVSGMHRSPYRGYSIEFAEHREYVPGDDLRHLDWRVWGRVDRLYVKQYEEETNLRTHMLVDCSASMRYPEGRPGERMDKFDYAATLAASLAFLLTHQQDAVGLRMFDDEVRSDLPAMSSQAHLQAIVSQLERALRDRPGTAAGMRRVVGESMGGRSLVVLISDLLMDAREFVRALDHLRFERHEVIVMHVLDADERTFPFSERTRFEGLESPDLHLTVDPASLRAAYLAALDSFVGMLRNECNARHVDFVELSTTDPLDVALRRYLAAREHLMKR